MKGWGYFFIKQRAVTKITNFCFIFSIAVFSELFKNFFFIYLFLVTVSVF